ncbi:hypothetical protein PSTG_13345 [Puccinia striiformis f. sp. tritici PST-78]|uniref:HAT C-terminal dimerisation domain-containing protein n=1 Tax=Puccinia striiformis f. sp. tritici PST-78 TaxID=1165861 RepID=A0A0L0V2T7_9BASI|nr:hypothetical protein PSTG_13345 [Puccinia striiformis f. sp. tritici PST-78]
MAGNRRKRRKPPGSPSSTSSIASQSQDPLPTGQNRPAGKTVVDVNDSDDDHSDIELAQSQGLTDEQELKKAKRVHMNQLSSCYASFDTPQLSNQVDKHGRRKIAYPCKTCGSLIHRPAYDSSPSNLSKHVASCQKKRHDAQDSQRLAAMGISGTGDIDPREVPQLCAIWCAEAARPFSALGDQSHQLILHPEVVKNSPSRKVVSCDIGRLYTAVQESLMVSLQNHTGALYLGLDAWQSPNGYDILGTVIYRMVADDVGGYELEAMPLDFVVLKERHTGVYMADTVRLVVEKFGVQNKICGIVTDNASNNETMIEAIKRFKWPRFKGTGQWVRCFAPILNLIVQVVLRPFGSHKKKATNTDLSNDDSEDSSDDDIPADCQIQRFSRDEIGDGDEDEDENVDSNSTLAADLIDDDEIELETEDVDELSDEGEDDHYTSQSCRETLAKFRAIARKLNKSPNSKAVFVEFCREKKCDKPYNIERDVKTRWNSTLVQLKSILRCSGAIIEWQKDKRLGPSRKHHIDQHDLDLARDLAEVLQPFYEITLQVSTRGAARISQVVVFIDQVTSHLSTAVSNKEDGYPPALRNACRAGLQLTNKYYTLTDCSPLYRVAMVLHPSFKDEYFKLAKWEPEWINEALRLTREMWENHYKPQAQPNTTKEGNSRPKWWIRQGKGGNTHGGLLQMALDVLSCPATTVDVERSFSFGRDYVSLRRHRLNAASVTRGMTVAFYSKNGKIKKGVLRRWKQEQRKKSREEE